MDISEVSLIKFEIHHNEKRLFFFFGLDELEELNELDELFFLRTGERSRVSSGRTDTEARGLLSVKKYRNVKLRDSA